jgi:PGF-pre-PGF domain-containing protein
MKFDFLNSIISILLITLIILGVIPSMAFALEVHSDIGNLGVGNSTNVNLDIASSSNEDSNPENSSIGESEVDGDYSSFSNSSGMDNSDSEQLDYNDSEQLDYNDSESSDCNDSELTDYDDSEQYLTDDWSDYDSSGSDLDVIYDFSWMDIFLCEPGDNILVKELAVRNIMGGCHIRFDFSENATCIKYIEFDPLMTFRKTIATAAVLKDISVFVREPPVGRIYQYTDIFIGDKGAGTPNSFKNGLVGFKVDKAWIKDNNVNESLVTLQWYNNSWESLYTEKVGEDNNYVYFKSGTPGFSCFAITEYTGKADENYTEKTDENYTEEDENYSEEDENYTEEDEDYTEETDEDYTEEMDEDYTEEVNENRTGKIDENCTGKVDKNYTKEVGKNCTGKVDKNCTGKVDKNCTGKVDKNYTGKVDKNYTGKVDKNCAGKVDIKRTGKVDKNCTGKVDIKRTGKTVKNCQKK